MAVPVAKVKQAAPSTHITLDERRVATVRAVGCFGVTTTIFYICYHVLSNNFTLNDQTILAVKIEATFCLIFIMATAAAKKMRRLSSYVLLAAFCSLFVLMALLFGRGTGSHIFLLTIGPMSALMLDMRRPYAILSISLIAGVLHLAVQFLIYPAMDPFYPLLRQINNPFITHLTLSQNDIFYIIDIMAVELGIGICVYLAMHWAAMAEAALTREYARSELLLRNLLPASIADRLKDNPSEIIADSFESITILFADVVNFTPASAFRKPEEVIAFLSTLFGEFDRLAEQHGLEKIKTIGDCYMVAGGMPEKSEHHTQAMANMALDMITASQKLMAEFDDGMSIRIGLHVGPAMAGVIGHNKPYYDVWGDTINVASRMESSSIPGRIQITPEVKDILGTRYDFESRGVVDIKGKGPMDLYFLVGKTTDL